MNFLQNQFKALLWITSIYKNLGRLTYLTGILLYCARYSVFLINFAIYVRIHIPFRYKSPWVLFWNLSLCFTDILTNCGKRLMTTEHWIASSTMDIVLSSLCFGNLVYWSCIVRISSKKSPWSSPTYGKPRYGKGGEVPRTIF